MGISTKPECPYHERLDQKENKETKIWKKRKKKFIFAINICKIPQVHKPHK